jgi:hypothetical protein
MLRAEQDQQHIAVVHSQIALAREYLSRFAGDDREISDAALPTECVRAASFMGSAKSGHDFYSDQATFDLLRAQWHRERGVTSSITAMAMCPAYQGIIGMGPKVIPLIMRQMDSEGDEPDMWFWALRVLTFANPVPDDARGDIVRMARAWLSWGQRYYAW